MESGGYLGVRDEVLGPHDAGVDVPLVLALRRVERAQPGELGGRHPPEHVRVRVRVRVRVSPNPNLNPNQPGELGGRHPPEHVAQRAQRVDRARGDVPRAADGRDERRDGGGKPAPRDLRAHLGERLLGLGVVRVRVGRPDREEGRRVPLPEQPQPEAAQAVDDARLAREASEGDEPGGRAAAALAHALVVDQPAALVEQLVEQRHVLGLARERG